jgi:hypothetical protein
VGSYWINVTALIIEETSAVGVFADTIVIPKGVEMFVYEKADRDPKVFCNIIDLYVVYVDSARLSCATNPTALAFKTNSAVKKIGMII